MLSKRNLMYLLLGVLCVQLLVGVGCKKPPPPPPPPPPEEPPPPPPPKPTVSLSAEPSSIERGKSATLKWSSQNAASASLNQGIGAVPASGSREVFPTQSTTYQVSVKGAGGEASASARVTVRVPPPPPPPPPPPDHGKLLSSATSDAYFDYDESDIRPDAEAALRNNSGALKDFFGKFSNLRVSVEGHCDERGTNEYNLALGDRRATAARDFLVGLGVPAGKLTTISYGEERSVCSMEEESCWQKNRRAHLSLK